MLSVQLRIVNIRTKIIFLKDYYGRLEKQPNFELDIKLSFKFKDSVLFKTSFAPLLMYTALFIINSY